MKTTYESIMERVTNSGQILEIGCGEQKLANAFGIDLQAHEGVDLVTDLNQGIPLEDERFDAITSNQVLEHIDNLNYLMEESFRVLRPGGIFVATVPYFRSSWAVIDPTHVRFFSLVTMDYYVEGKLQHDLHRFIDPAFSDIEVYADLLTGPSLLGAPLRALAKRYPNKYENSALSFLQPFQDVTFILTK